MLEPIVPLKIRVFQNSGSSIFFHYFKDPGSDSGFSFLYIVWSFEFRLGLPIGFNARVGTDRALEDSSFSKLGFFHFFHYFKETGFRLGFFLFIYLIWSFEFRLGLPIGFNTRVGTDRALEDSSFSKLGFLSIFLFLKDPGSDSGFPFYISFWSFEFRLGLPFGSNDVVLEPICAMSRIRVLKTRFSFILLFWKKKNRVPTRIFSFCIYRLIFPEVTSSDSDFLLVPMFALDQLLRREFEFSKTRFSFILLFWKTGFRLAFSPFIYIFIFPESRVPIRTSFWSRCSRWTNCYVLNSSSQKLDSHSFFFWKTGFRLGFPAFLHIFIFRVRTQIFSVKSNARVGPNFSLFSFQVKG